MDNSEACPKCGSFDYQYARKPIEGGVQLRKQCRDCGSISSRSYKQSEVENIESVPFVNQQKYEQLNEHEYQQYKQQRQEEKESWMVGYSEYLQSPLWKRKREHVLRRDRNLCQRCLEKEATEVHHLTYEHWGNELTSELISLCHDCHESFSGTH